jgi:hypothetical protein
VQGHGFATGNRTHGNSVTHRCAGQLFERIISAAVTMEVESGLFWIFDQHTRMHKGTGDATDESLDQAFEYDDVSRCRRTMKSRSAVDEGIRTTGHQHVQMNIQIKSCTLHLSKPRIRDKGTVSLVN